MLPQGWTRHAMDNRPRKEWMQKKTPSGENGKSTLNANRYPTPDQVGGRLSQTRSGGDLFPKMTSDHPRHERNLTQQHDGRPAQRQRARKDDGEFDKGRPRMVVEDILQPDDEDVVDQENAVGRGP